jgi:ribosomal protein S18 acetylase RimI-like enzyme
MLLISPQESDSFAATSQIIVSSRERAISKARTTVMHSLDNHPLDNVIWNALTTRHAQFAEGQGAARKFIREVGPLSAFENGHDEGYSSLAGLLGDKDVVAVFLDTPYEARQGWQWIAGAPLVQMVFENGSGSMAHTNSSQELVELGTRDSQEMIELTALTKPGPFGPRTHELGTYLGIRVEGKLIAMAGERLKVPRYTEVSAVCTHPDYLGRGYAGMLMAEVMRRIQARGETPFLHVREDNTRAIGLYERLGYRIRKKGHFAVLRKSQELS